MKVGIVVLVGFVFCICQNATSSLPEHRKRDQSGEDEFIRVQPDSKIYFHVIRKESLLVGPRLSSRDGVTVHMVDHNKGLTPTPTRYTVLKNGVLVPKAGDVNMHNAAVLKSRKLIFYVRGFKGILIPIGVLYPKKRQADFVGEESIATLAKLQQKASAENSRHGGVSSDTNDTREEKSTEFASTEPSAKWNSEDDRTSCTSTESLEYHAPDKTCNDEVTLFVLHSNGVMRRTPADPYLPMGIQMSYTVQKNFVIRPKMLESSTDFAVKYFMGKNGDLVPYADNEYTIKTPNGTLVTFLLGDTGSLIPVKEEDSGDGLINYYHNGNLLHRSSQFQTIFGSSESILINDREHHLHGHNSGTKNHSLRKRSIYPEEFIVNPPALIPHKNQVAILSDQPVIRPDPIIQQRVILPPQSSTRVISRPPPPPVMIHRPLVSRPVVAQQVVPPPHHRASPMPAIVYEQTPVQPKDLPLPPREVYHPKTEFASEFADVGLPNEAQPRMTVRNDLFTYDDKGIKIPLVPELTESNDVVLYKLTCKGNLVRYPHCKEPEFGFDIHFQILLDEFVLVPVTMNNRPMHITYVLQENGDLIPAESNTNTFKKAPGSLIYFILGKNNVLFPVQQKVELDGSLSFFYQDYFLLKLPDTSNKPLHFSTVSRPLFAYYNGLTIVTMSSKPRLNPVRGSNWRSHCACGLKEETGAKDIFLSGPNDVLIRIAPYRTKTGSTVIYELDSNGILYRSPKDKKRCIILKSYVVLKEGILVPSNDTTGYMFMMSKNGDMFPYLYPEGKLEAPPGESLKFLLCEKGILLPMELELVDNHLCYFFHDVIVYKERVYYKEDLDADRAPLKLQHKDGCENPSRPGEKSGVQPLIMADGTIVYYERQDRLLRRNPPDVVPNHLCYTMASFELQPDGSLFQIRFQEPDDDVVNLMLEPNGDLLSDTRNEHSSLSLYYILDVNGNLIAVEGRKTRKSIYFYKNHVKICRVRIPENHHSTEKLDTDNKTPLGRDPLKLMDDPEPRNSNGGDSQTFYIPIPLKSVPASESAEDKKKPRCDGSKETMAIELEINDEIIQEMKNWAAKCDKVLTKQEVERSLAEALKGLNVAGLLKNEAPSK